MSENTKKTLKIEFEGPDGSGKTTALKYFIEMARKYGSTVVETREVGNPHVPACTKMREFVLDPNNNLSGETMEYIFCAMRLENDRWLKTIKNSANAPDFVVSDRGWFSHLAYTDHNVSEKFTEELYGPLSKITELPDIVIYFSVNTDTALKRRVKRGEGMDAIEIKGVEFQEKVRGSFDKYLKKVNDDLVWDFDTQTAIKKDKVTIFEVDANASILEVQKQVDSILESILSSR